MRIAVLGPLEVSTDDGPPVQVPGAKERLLLAALAAEAPGVVSTDALVDAIWDGDPPASARKSLQAHLVRLRSSLEPGRPHGSTGRYVVRRGAGYALAVDRADVDALLIGDLAARGHAKLRAGAYAEAEQELAAAVALWRGEPWADWPEAAFPQAERQRLREVRTTALAGLLEARLQLGRHAEVLPELERCVAEDPLREDWWRLLLLALYRSGRQADALAAARRARAVLAEELGAAPGPALRQTEAAILAQDASIELPPAETPEPPPPAPAVPGACPYKGLAAYQAADAPLFHGRSRVVAALVARLVDAPLVVVSGPSGAGKSSVVRAGLVPALAAGALPGSRSWCPLLLTPGHRPVDALAPLTGEAPPTAPVLLVCDQFEELWAPDVDPAERAAFLDTVVGLLDDCVVVRCVLVVRGDHVGRLAEHSALADRAGGALVLVPTLTDAELREVVRGPARAAGLTVEPELLDAVAADGLGRPAALPLLSTALVGTWERRSGDLLTLAGYLRSGGVAGALTRSAETAYAALDDAGRETARRLLVRLADVDDGGALVRRRVPLDELGLDGDAGSPRRAVVEAFVGRRLLTVDGDRLEVTHEALLTAWPRLAHWLEDDAAGRAVRRHLAPAAREWAAAGRPDDELVRGARLAAALDWASGPGADLTPVEREFLDASQARADAELLATRERADREAAGWRRTKRLAVALAGILVLALVATVLAVRAQQQAQEASLVADANRLAAQSTTAGSLDLALLLAAQAARLADTPETQDGLLTALTESGRAERALPFPGTPFNALLTGGGRTLTFGTGAEVVAWEVGPSTQARVGYRIPDWGAWLTAAASPTEDVVMGAGVRNDVPWVRMIAPDGTDRLLQEGDEVGGIPVSGTVSPDGRRVHLLVATPEDNGPTRWRITDVSAVDGSTRDTGIEGTSTAPVEALTADFSADAGSVVLWGGGGTAAPTLIDLSDGRRSPVTTGPASEEILDFRALSHGAALLKADGGVTLVDDNGSPVQQLTAHQEPVRDLVMSPEGTWAVTVGDGSRVVLWDVAPSTGRWSQRETLTGHGGDVLGAVIDPSGRRLITVATDHTIISWDMTADGGLGTSYPGLAGRWIANRPRVIEPGGLLVAPTRPGVPYGEEQGSVPGPDTLSVAATFFDPTTGDVVQHVPVGDTIPQVVFGSSVTVSPDHSMVAVTWGLGTTVLDARTREVITEIVLPPTGDRGADGEPLPAAVVWCTGWTPDGSTLLLGATADAVDGTRGHLVPVNTATWELGDPIEIGSAQAIEASPDGEMLAVALVGGPQIVVLDAETLDVEQTVSLQGDDRVGDLVFSPDGRLLAAGGQQGLLHLIDTEAWEQVAEPVGMQNGGLLQIEWLDDGRTVVASGMIGTVSLFDVDRGVIRGRPLRGSAEPGEGYAHLVPGPTDELVVLSGERSGRRYPLTLSAWLSEACAIVGRDMTRAEWNRYLPEREYEPTCTDLR